MIENIAIIAIVVGLIITIIIMRVSDIKIDPCPHANTFTYTDSTIVTCEKTTITCLDCGDKLSTKTDCR